MHTRTCGELRAENIGEEVKLTGWVSRRRDHGGLIFCDLRDREGITQCTFDPEHAAGEAFHTAETMRPEWPILVHGTVIARDEDTVNPKLPTGEIEVLADRVEVLNRSKTPPFQIEDGIETSEDTRLRYRYLDLRRPEMMANLKLRSDFTFAIRSALHDRAFMEVETPSLFKSTPEGARDFIVPSRLQPGSFYALPQSPQLLKQLLMVGGVERYYQVAKCFRDEDLRADRQPEFTQVDIEMSFVDQDDVMGALEDVLHDAFAHMGVDMPTPLRRLSYWDAMDTYGSDKPDTRFGMTLVDLTDVFKSSKFKVFAGAANTEGQVVKAINAKGAGAWPRAQIDKLAKVAETFGAKGLAWIAFREDGSINSPIVKFFSDEEMAELRRRCDVEPGDLVMFAAGPRLASDEILGGMRSHMADALGIERTGHDFLWVVDFPLFHWDDEAKRYEAEHQPFTLPHVDELDLLETDPLAMGSCTYDFVMDGFEAGGGGMRIHDSELQLKMLEFMGFSEERAREQFGFLMEALTFGAPPMGGFALGLDRVCMLLAGSDSIRDVMAFPKTSSGSDLMSAAPSEVSMAQLKEVGLRLM
ncbi:aspartate--tRNA ligase [Collinsella tanakaei]|uniref:Aspartate--tRNA(Asp/Asn) ligase n=1 Tax=Collinsella ihumii TaxID=1720204 RepID=A0A921IRY6_9ACTN|nr:aspartate--tRNA ligase [Collinsella sp. An271]MBM6777346.1 aspartate--tRNA ligase [Collinsella tanakaei]MBM6786728.1 aspartate--tRNA ligase [Collinsella tanakaei]OUO60633.1 aspartate--tRNA ligase [Collinsella sp. An271]HJG31594.1 aspartate--tRNA ligase [Collinsella ihumii]